MAVRIEFAEVAPLRAPELSWPQFFEGNLHGAFAIPPLGGLPPAGIRTVVDAEAIRARVVRDITPSLSDPRLRDASVTVNIDHAAPAKISTTVRGRIEESVGPLGCSVRFVASASSTLSVAAPDLLVERTEGEVDRDNWDVLWCSTKIGLAGGLAYMPFGLMIGFAIGFAQWFVESLVLISRARPPIRPPAGSSPTPATGPLKKKVLRTIKTCEKIEPEDKDFGYECRYRYVVVEVT